jgi:hypothetical protein
LIFNFLDSGASEHHHQRFWAHGNRLQGVGFQTPARKHRVGYADRADNEWAMQIAPIKGCEGETNRGDFATRALSATEHRNCPPRSSRCSSIGAEARSNMERFFSELGAFDHLAVTVGDTLLNKQIIWLTDEGSFEPFCPP